MNSSQIYYILKSQKSSITLLAFLISELGNSQVLFLSKKNSNDTFISFATKSNVKKSNISFELTASLLPKAKITRDQGNYKLRSHLQPAYDFGINYGHIINKNMNVSAGFHIVIESINFYSRIPNSDLPNGFSGERPPLIVDRDAWGAIRIPVLFEKSTNTKKLGPVFFMLGSSLRYNGFMTDVSIGTAIIDSNGQITEVFNADLFPRNNGKPWVTFLGGASKHFVLDNKNILFVGIQADISTTYFYKGSYEITIPNKPVTSGTYKISGTSIGLSVQYIFTGYNKRMVRNYQKKAV